MVSLCVAGFSGGATKSDSLSTHCYPPNVGFQVDTGENATGPSPKGCADDMPAFAIPISDGSSRCFNQAEIVSCQGHLWIMQPLVDISNGSRPVRSASRCQLKRPVSGVLIASGWPESAGIFHVRSMSAVGAWSPRLHLAQRSLVVPSRVQ
jgi:hypothetical protein